MKKLWVFIGVISLVLFGCRSNELGEESAYGDDVNQIEGVSLELNKATYQPEEDTIELTVVNESEGEITYGVAYALEFCDEGTWFQVEPEEEMMFIQIAHILAPGDEAKEELNLEFYTPMAPGPYRLVRLIDGNAVTAEFEVVE